MKSRVTKTSESLAKYIRQPYACLRLCLGALLAMLVPPVPPAFAETVSGAPDVAVRAAAVALFRNHAVLRVNGRQYTLKAGKSTPEGVLLVESNSETATVEIGGERLTLRLDGKIVGHYPRGIAAKSLQLYPDATGHYAVDGTINGNRIHFLIDTGATSVSINKATAKRIGLLYRVDGKPTFVETAAGVVPAYRVQFDEVSARHVTLKRVEGLVLDGDYPRVALLGQSFLNRLDMRRAGQLLELQER